MEHKFKRVFALLLSMLMLMNSVPVNAFATETHDHSEVNAVADTDHTHSLAFVEAKDASCTEDGNIAYFVCEDESCAKYFYDQDGASEIPAESVLVAASHSWDEGVVTTEATETAEGVMTYTCIVCGETKTEVIPMLEHTHSLSQAESAEYWVCACGAKFTDETGTTVYEEPAVVVEECVHSTLTAKEAVDATCEASGSSAYWSCDDCGKYFSDEGVTEIGENSWVIPAAHSLTKTDAVEGTCTTPGNIAYWSCGDCGKYFSDEGVTEIAADSWVVTGDHSLEKMNAVDASCTVPGTAAYWICSDCGKRFSDAEGITEIDYVAHTAHAFSGYTWDFSQGSATSTDGGNTLSLVKTSVSGVTAVDGLLTDGTLAASKTTTMQLTEPVTLNASEDWTVELVVKGNGTTIRSFLSTHVTIGDAVYFYIGGDGDLSLVKKGSFTNEAGTSVSNSYLYYKVSDADYEASALASDEFDQTKYHNYQLRCTDGVFSFWLDGVKVGNLSMTEKATTRGTSDAEYTTGSGTPFDLSSLTVNYVGCGSSTNAVSQGLTGTVKYLGIYPGHSYTNACDTSCNNAGCDETRVAGHEWDEGVVTTEPSATEDGVKTYTCSVCGGTTIETIPATGCDHSMTHTEAVAATCTTQGNSEYWTCSVCGKFFSDELGTNEIEEHSWVTSVAAHSLTKTEAVEVTCDVDGNSEYWTCSVCKKFFSDEGTTEIDENSWIIKTEGHKYEASTTDASCTSHGSTVQTCSVCGDSYEENYKYALSGHTWDFAQSSASNQGNSLALATGLKTDGVTARPNGSFTVADGVMTGSSVTVEMSEGIELSEAEDWAVEAILRSASASTSPKVLLAESNMFSEGTSIFLLNTGDLYLAQKGTVEGTNTYWYFKVSDADFEANMPEDFDITEYHTYRMECTSGVFSYWLDGEKIGDLAVTSNNQARVSSATVHEGMYLDYSSITAKFIGSGNSGSLKTFGFSGDMKYLGIYPGHSWDNACDTTCSNGCGETRVVSHDWDDGVVTKEPSASAEGEKTYTCSVCKETTTESIPATVYTWTFDDGTATSTNGRRTFTYVTTHDKGTAVTQKDTLTFTAGAMNAAGVALEMEEGIRVTSDKNWAFEITMKSSTSPKTVLAESKGYSKGTSIFLTDTGDMLLMQKGTVEGTNTYWYFKVSDADFETNMPADFDIAKYHTYRLECTDGTFSYWLDGRKIGDYTLTSNSQARGSSATEYDGMYLSYSDITFRYMGNGSSGNVLAYKFTGDVDSMSIYTDIPAHVHAPEKVEATASTCVVAGNNAYWVCSCGIYKDEACTEATTVEAEKLNLAAHTYGDAVFTWTDDGKSATASITCSVCTEGTEGHTLTGDADVEQTGSTVGDCQTNSTVSYKATITLDGKSYTEDKTVEGALGSHSMTATAANDATCTEPGNNTYWTCSICEKVYKDEDGITETTLEEETLPQLEHDYSEPVFAWAQDYKSCEVTAVCSVGGETINLPCKVTSKSTDATCVTPGTVVRTATATLGDQTYTEKKTEEGAALGHTYGEAVFVWADDGKSATASINCSVCSENTEGHTLTGAADVEQTDTTAGDCKTNSTTTYTASITLDGKSYTEDKTVEGALGSHSMTATAANDATCTEPGNNAYWTCFICEKVYKEEAGTTETSVAAETIAALGHTYGDAVFTWTDDGKSATASITCSVCTEGTEDHTLTGDADVEQTGSIVGDCQTNSTVSYKATITLDGKSYTEDKTVEGALGSHSLTKVEAEEATCAIAGHSEYWTCSECEKLFSDENGTTEIESVEQIPTITDHVWDFSQNSTSSTDGKNTLTLMTSKDVYGDFTVSGGEWASNKQIYKLSEAVTLNSANDWTFEIVAKGNGTNAIGTVLSNTRKYGSASGFIYINGDGDLMIGRYGATLAVDDGTEVTASDKYVYYKVSNADYEASVLNSGSFDITEYHTYQLRCEDGVFSYWVDGAKIGNLAMTEYGTGRSSSNKEFTGAGEFHTGTHNDFTNLVMDHIGNGNSSGTPVFGLIATVKSLGIYPGHSFTNSCDASCDNEGCTHTREIWHSWNNGEITKAPTEDAEGERMYTCTICGETKTEVIPAVGKIVMKYDDRLAISDLGQKGEPVIITNTVTSRKVGTETPDDAVLTYVDGKLIATGVGTATVTWGTGSQAIDYNITVEPATISMIMVTGHSLGSGSQGTASKTIVCEEGQVYATNERAYDWKITTGSTSTETVEGTDVTGMGLGYGSTLRPKEINELNPGGGVNGVDSAVAYRWAQLTGEKIWILNSAKGSTSLSTWQKGGFNYRHAVELFTTAEEILYNEVQAGHYKVNKLGIVNFTTANGDQTWAADKYTDAFNSMWEGFQEEMAIYDFDGDGISDTVDCISLLPLWNVCSMNGWDKLHKEPLAFFTTSGTKYYGKLINYSMSVFGDNGVILGSSAMRQWTNDADVAAYFKANPVEQMYGKLQDGTTHTSPTTVRNGVYGDGVHYGQLGYNVQGIDIAQNMYDYWYGNNAVTSVKLLQGNGVDEVPENIQVHVGDEYPIVPEAAPACAKLTYTIDGYAVSYENCIVTGVSVGTAVLTIKDQAGNALKTVNITVLPAIEEEPEEVVWYSWDFAQASATNTTGSATDNTLTLVKSADSSVSTIEDLLKDGTLAASQATTMQMSKSVTLDTSNNWAVELVAKSEDGSSIRSFLSTDVTLTGTYFYIDGNGDLSIVHKGSFRADDGTTVASNYTYYKVSDEDYNASILGSGSFDITQYHSYQLRCSNGVFSYWLDGEKIGDLALSEQTTVRGDGAKEYTKNNGTPFDFSNMVMTHLGCGSSNNAASQGLTATVKNLNLYTNSGTLNLEVGLDALSSIAPMFAFPGESIVLPKPYNGQYCAKFLGWADNQDGTGTLLAAGTSYTLTGFEPVTLYGIWQAFETSDGVHTYENGVCTSCGVADGSYNPWDIWDFEDSTTISDDDVTSIGRITTNHLGSAVTNNGIMSVSGGVMHVDTAALEMSESNVLSADKDWAFDFTMKANVDTNGEVITPKTLLAESKLFSEGTSFYLTATGDMLMAQKGTVGGTNTYWYFKVSNADFAANMPARFDITQYHTYRVMCSDGTFSYWIDGEKIGDFALTSNTMYRGGTTYTGQKLDYSNINVRYIGNGNTGNCKAFGFTGDVERIGIYTESGYLTYNMQESHAEAIAVQQIYPGETITLAKPDTGEYCVKFTGWTKAQDGSGTVYAAGDSYQVSGMETFTLYGNWEERTNSTAHSYGNKGVITAPTCAAEGYTTYTCTFCGHEKYTDHTAKSAHDFSAEVVSDEFLCDEPTYDSAPTYYRSCTVCGLSSQGTGGESTFESGRPGDGYYSVVSKQDWDTAPGITESEIILNNSTGERRQAVHVMEVDLSDPYASILPSYMGMNPTLGNYQLGTMSEQAGWVEDNMGLNVVGAMNTCLSWYDSAYYDENPELKNEPLGILVINGELYAQNTSAKTCLVVNYDEKDGVERPANIPKVELRYTKDGVTGWEEQVISCNFDFIVKDGKNTSKVSHENQSSKSVLGIKEDGTIVIMQNDGEQAPYSNGMSVYEIGETMIALGCVYAVRCDGGGTSTYLSQRPGEELAVTCSPADGAERPTTSGILVISSAPATGEFMRASISSENTYYAPGCTVEFDVVGTDLVGTKVEVPEDAVWQIKQDGMGTIEDGVFVSNGTAGEVTVQIVYNERIVGEHTIEIVVPETFQFRQSIITVPFGKTVEIAMTATTNKGLNTVTLNPDDIVITTDNEALGTFDGTSFTAVVEKDAPTNLYSTITATMKSTGMTATAELNLGKASVIIDDFEDGISDWSMDNVGNRALVDFEFQETNRQNGYVYNGDGAMGMIMKNDDQTISAGSYAQLKVSHKEGVVIESGTSVGAWIYIPDDFYNLWIRMSFYTKDENGNYTKRNIVNCVEGGEVYTTIEESGWHYFSCDISEYDSVMIQNIFIEILSQHCSANALYQTTGSPHGMSAIYIDDVTVDYSEAADDREAPVFDSVTLVAGGTETALKKREMATSANSVVTVKAAVSENLTKTNATGLDEKSAKAYVDGVPVSCSYADSVISIQNVALPDGVHRVKFAISDNAGNTATVIRVINVASGVAASTIEVVPAEPALDRLYGGSVYWMDLNANQIETIQEVSFDIDLNAVNHWELDHMELAEGFSAAYTVDEKTNTASITITRTGDCTLSGRQTLASLPIRVIYYDTDIALEGYTAQTFWTDYNFWPQDVAVDVDRGVIKYVDGYTSNVLNTFSSREYSIDTEMYTSGQHMDPAYRTERGTAHVHDAKALDNMVPTCTEDGYTGRTYCEICESVVAWGTKKPATGHQYTEKNGVVSCETCGEKLNGVWNGKSYMDGVLANGWVDSTYYYVDGEKVTGHYVIEGTMYTFDENGVYDPTYIYTDFFETEDGRLMYFANNESLTGYQYLQGEGYYFDENGYGLEGEHIMAGETCLFANGKYVSCSTADVISAGMVGPSASYVLYTDGTFKLDGSGDTYNYYSHGTRPYAEDAWRIKKLEVAAEITSIGAGFMMNSYVSEVVFEEGSELRTIGREAFKQCYKLKEIELPYKVSTLGKEAFYNSTNLAKIVMPVSVTTIDSSAFKNWVALTMYVVNGSYSMAYAIENQIPYVSYIPDPAGMNGIVWLNGEMYYYKDGKPYYAGLIEIDGYYYYVNSSCKVVTGKYYVTKNNGLMESDYYNFGEDGKMIPSKTGIYEEDGTMYYYKNGQKYYAGLIEIDGEYYYVNSSCIVVTGKYYVNKNNGLMPSDYYVFDEDGKMIRKNGIIEEDGGLYYYKNGERNYAGLIMIDGGYYYVNSSCKVVTGRYYVNKNNGLMDSGYYFFDETGRMDQKTGIYEDADGVLRYYENGFLTYAGLIEIDGYYHYVNSSAKVVTGRYYITKNNGLMPSDYYAFDDTGRMIMKNGIVEENGGLYYYKNGSLYYAGLIEIDGDYYYVNSKAQVVTGKYSVYKTNDLLPAGEYLFDSTGKMILDSKNGIVEENGGLYYYKNGSLYYAGLIEIDGYYYYVNGSAKVVTGRYYVNKNNGLMESGYYDFDETGKMIAG